MPIQSSKSAQLTPTDIPTVDEALALRCRACGQQREYKVGSIILDPACIEKFPPMSGLQDLDKLKTMDWQEWVRFTGYFLCANCGSGGPWEIPESARTQLALLLVAHVMNPDSSGVFIGQPRLFDGTVMRTAFEAETHLKRLLQADPDSAFLWSRLGNLYDGANMPALALQAFLQAVELDPLDNEALHSLGNHWFDQGDYAQSAHYYHQVLRHCREGTWRRDDLKENLVRHALETLMEINHRTGGAVEVFPPPEKVDGAALPNETAVVYLTEFNLSKEKDWQRLVRTFLDDPATSAAPTNKRRPLEQTRASWEAPQRDASVPVANAKILVGRNDPCPCESGKKFKKCCGRR